MVDLSIVVPVYGCEPCLAALNERLSSTLDRLGVTYEVVYVDDRSPDGAWSVLTELAREDANVHAVGSVATSVNIRRSRQAWPELAAAGSW